jgi:MFS family permease
MMTMSSLNIEYSKGLRRSALLIASLSSFLTPFMGSSITLSTPTIALDLGMDAVSQGWTVTAYLLAAAMFLVPFGKLADIHGRKRFFKYGIILDAIATVLCAITASAPWFISSRALQGVGDAMIFGTSTAILVTVYPFKDRGKVLGISTAATYFGLSTGPFVGGILAQDFGWRSVFVSMLILDLIIIVLLFSYLKGEWVGTEGEEFDTMGSLMYGFTLFSIIYGFSLVPLTEASWLIVAGLLGLVVFIARESRAKYPVLELKLFRHNAVFAFSNLAAMINYSATYPVSFLMSLYLREVRGFSIEYSGLVLVSQPILQAIFSPIAGRLSDRMEPRIVSSIGMGILVFGLSLFVPISDATDLRFIVLNLMLLGFGFALFSSPNMNAIMSSVKGQFYGIASATAGTMRLVGQSLSLGVTMLFFAFIIGRIPTTDPTYPVLLMNSMRALFTAFAVLCFIGIFASLARGRVHER